MKTVITLLICQLPIFAFAQNEMSDSIKTQELKEVVIEASNQRTNADVSTYIPMSRQKNAAQNAVSLLAQMSIPQIDVDPVSMAVTNTQGQNVALFIDYLPATTQDLQGLKTQDVKKVEYYLHPTDARFQGERYVINFVMQKYEWGGYTKVNANKWFGVNRTDGSVYSKIVYKRMTFDFFADEIYLTNRHTGQSSIETFKFTDLYGKGQQTIGRFSDTNSSLYRNNSNDFSFRALYNTDKIQISNRLAYSLTNVPHNDATNSLLYIPEIIETASSSTASSKRDWSIAYSGRYYIYISENAAINTNLGYTYGHNTSNSLFTIPSVTSITNNAKEDVHRIEVYPRLNWHPNKYNQFVFTAGVIHNRNIINYLGDSPSKQNYNMGAYYLGSAYTHVFDKWEVGGELAWIWETNRITGHRMDNNFPQVNLNATWSPNNKHQIYISGNYGQDVPDASQKSPNMLQQDELMWYRGTPELKDYKYSNAGITYTWLPNNKWQLSADGYIGIIKDRCVTLYSPTGPNGTMLRQYFNGGDYTSSFLGVSATSKFFGGKLVAKLRPQFWIRKTSGDYAWRSNELTCTVQLTYYFGNFYLWGWYMTPSKYQETHSGVISRTPSKYQIQIGWGKGAWNINASAYNFFHTSWEDYKETLSGEYYSFDRTAFGTQHHARYMVSVTYTVGYGKKVQRNNEISGSGTVGSAILK